MMQGRIARLPAWLRWALVVPAGLIGAIAIHTLIWFMSFAGSILAFRLPDNDPYNLYVLIDYGAMSWAFVSAAATMAPSHQRRVAEVLSGLLILIMCSLFTVLIALTGLGLDQALLAASVGVPTVVGVAIAVHGFQRFTAQENDPAS